jgi:hypothetical protein
MTVPGPAPRQESSPTRFLAGARHRDDHDRGADPHTPKEPFRLAREHPDAAVGARVPDGRTIRRPVNADSVRAQAHPARSERVPRPRRDRLEAVRPARVGRVPPGMADLACDLEAPERRRVGGSPRADRQAADELNPLIEESRCEPRRTTTTGPNFALVTAGRTRSIRTRTAVRSSPPNRRMSARMRRGRTIRHPAWARLILGRRPWRPTSLAFRGGSQTRSFTAAA